MRLTGDALARAQWDFVIRKQLDEGVLNSAVIQNDDELKWDVKSGELWRFLAIILYSTDATGDIKVDMAASTSTADWLIRYLGETTANAVLSGVQINAAAGNFTALAAGGGTTTILRKVQIEGFVKANANQTVNVRFAQNTQTGGQTATVKAGSLLYVKRLGLGT